MHHYKAALTILLASLALPIAATAEVFLPGMQPLEAGIEFAKVAQCNMCHAKTNNGDADPYLSWQSGMMAQAARDPVFRATMSIANQDIPGVGEFCLRCHAPRGWLEDRSKPADGSALNTEDMHGVSCDICHRLIDPLSDEAAKLIRHVPPGRGNAMMVADPENKVRGPYGDGTGAMPHLVMKSPFHASGELCGTCHDISNPVFAGDVNAEPPYSFGHIERTYSEWALSVFAARGKDGSCQSCHYPTVKGGGQASRFGSKQRDYFVIHGPVGGSTWVQDAVLHVWPDEGIDPKAAKLGKKRSLALLKTAASLKVTFETAGRATLRITNLTGHKLPTGYPEGRRMWVNVVFSDAADNTIKEMGRYGTIDDTIFGEPIQAPTLLDPDDTRVYECLPGLSESQAHKYNKQPGKSFHFVLNDIIVKDNRIPPEGFTNAAFKQHLSQPVDAAYPDGQYWDDFELQLPDGCAKVIVRLMYQSVSWEYVKFLAEQNQTDDWGKKLYDAWSQTGKCPPESIAEIRVSVPPRRYAAQP
jgi:hypothetical protein